MKTLITILLTCLTFMSFGQLKFDSTTNLVSGSVKCKFSRATMSGGPWGEAGSGNLPMNSSLTIKMNNKGTGTILLHFGKKESYDISNSSFSNGSFEFELREKDGPIKAASLTLGDNVEQAFILIDKKKNIEIRFSE